MIDHNCYQSYDESLCGLIARYPFYYGFVVQAPFESTREVDIAAISMNTKTAKMRLSLNPDTFVKFNLKDRMFILAHEMLHVIYMHTFSPYIKHEFWNIATDMAINDLLISQGFSLPRNPENHEESIGITSKSVYDSLVAAWEKTDPDLRVKTITVPIRGQDALYYFNWLLENSPPEEKSKPQPSKASNQQGSGGGGGPGKSNENEGSGNGSGQSPEVGNQNSVKPTMANNIKETLDELIEKAKHDWENISDEDKQFVKHIVAEAVKQASNHASPPGGIAGFVTELIESLKPKESWERRVARFSGMLGGLEGKTTMARKNKYGSFPRYVFKPSKKLMVFVDTSGSVYKAQLASALGAIESIAKHASVEIMWIDYQVNEIISFEVAKRRAKEMGGYSARGRGGTSMRAGFKYLKEHKIKVDGVIVMSDLELGSYYGEYYGFPSKAELNGLRVLWVGLKGNEDTHPVPPGIGQAVYIPAESKK